MTTRYQDARQDQPVWPEVTGQPAGSCPTLRGADFLFQHASWSPIICAAHFCAARDSRLASRVFDKLAAVDVGVDRAALDQVGVAAPARRSCPSPALMMLSAVSTVHNTLSMTKLVRPS